MSILGNTIPVSIACPALLGGNDEMIRKYKDKYEVSVPDGRYANGRVKIKGNNKNRTRGIIQNGN